MKIAVYQCPRHPHIYTLSIDRKDGTGTRLTSAKCCSLQYGEMVCSWNMTDRLYERFVEKGAAREGRRS